MVTIRHATPDDAETLQDLILELAAYEQLLDEAEPSVELLREHLSEEALTGCEALIAETESGTAVGFALFFHNYSTSYERGALPGRPVREADVPGRGHWLFPAPAVCGDCAGARVSPYGMGVPTAVGME